MRISDIVVEQGIISQIKKDYDRGYDAVDKIVNPKRWGEQPAATDKTTAAIDPLDVKDAVQTLIQGKPVYEDQRLMLLKLAKQLQAGAVETKQDPEQLAAILKFAAAGKPINDQQRAILSQFLKER